jgi:hypothetical protein
VRLQNLCPRAAALHETVCASAVPKPSSFIVSLSPFESVWILGGLFNVLILLEMMMHGLLLRLVF